MKSAIVVVLAFYFSTFNLLSQDYNKYLKLYYNFNNENCYDVSGNGLNGTPVNNPTYIDDGIEGKAISFQGKGYYIDLGSDVSAIGSHVLIPSINFHECGEFTLSLWVRYRELSHIAGETFISFGNHSYGWLGIFNSSIIDYQENKQLIFTAGGHFWDNVFYTDFDRVKEFNKWNHYVLTYKNEVLKIYINGNFIGSSIHKLDVYENTAALARHWWYYDTDRTSARFTGDMDEVMIFCKALTDDEVKDLFHPCQKPDAEILSSDNYICEGDTVTLRLSKNFKNILWSTGETSDSIKVTQSGNYSVRYYDESNCVGYDIINVQYNGENYFSYSISENKKDVQFDSVGYSQMKCLPITITNISDKERVLDYAHLLFNLEFSLPPSQLPITIPPKSNVEILVCLTPNRLGLIRDTLILEDNCSSHRIPLEGIGSPNHYQASSNCQVILTSETIDIVNGGYLGIAPYYDERMEQLQLVFSGKSASNSQLQVSIIDNLGQLIKSDQIASNSISGNYTIELNDLQSGMYIAKIEYLNNILIYKFMKF